MDGAKGSVPGARRTQEERSAATRRALVAAARPLFAEHGYAGVGTEAVVRAAGVTRGAMYHQFSDKAALFEAVIEEIEAGLVADLASRVPAGADDPAAFLADAVDAWFASCASPEVQRLMVDGPAVLGWDRWRAVVMANGGALVEAVVRDLIDRGRVAPLPVEALARVLVAALEEAGLAVARSADPAVTGAEMRMVVLALLDGLMVD
ncbi:MAG: TetR/AcrR family transcriptional regulator [Acidimicrobiales bacterium]|nr:TetR/AcrR family transcriptional regulator [Acidimicrobiales bacterium]